MMYIYKHICPIYIYRAYRPIYAPSRECTLIQAGERGGFCENHIVEKGWGIFWKGGVDSERLAYRYLKWEYIFWPGRVGFRECPTVAYGCLKGGIFWEGGVDFGSVAYSCRIGE